MGVINAFPSGAPVQEYKNKVEITTSQEWTAPERVTEIRVTCIGGGAAGEYDGRGGGGGYFAQKILQVTPNAKYKIVIGSGGKYTSGSNVSGGGDTSFSNEIVAKGVATPNGGTGGGGACYYGGSSSYTKWKAAGKGQSGYGADGGEVGNDGAANGGSTLTAYGGAGTFGHYSTSTTSGTEYNGNGGGGGGAGINGGDGGAGCSFYNRGEWGHGGGGGGYGDIKLSTDGMYASSWGGSIDTIGAKGGLGYGAGGGGGKIPGNGAPGICIIEY